MLDELGHQTEVEGPLRAQPFVAAGQCDAHGNVERQHTGQTHHLAARHQADAHVGIEELGALGRDHDVAGRHQVEAGPAA